MVDVSWRAIGSAGNDDLLARGVVGRATVPCRLGSCAMRWPPIATVRITESSAIEAFLYYGRLTALDSSAMIRLRT